MANTKYYEMNMILEYPKVFKENADMGDPESSKTWLRKLAKDGGKTSVNAYFTSEEQLQTFLDDGFEVMYTDNQTGEKRSRIKEGDYGIGKFIKLERLIVDIKEFKDKKTGEFKEVDFGGLPPVIYQLDGVENNRDWVYESDGNLGHGTEAVVAFSLYNKSKTRLEAIAVTKHIPWEKEESGLSSTFKVPNSN